MMTFIAILHIFVALILILFVLIQDSKGGGMGAFGGGGGGNTVFGATGAADFLTKATRWLAIFFAISCVGLAYLTSKKEDSVLDAEAPISSSSSTEKSAPKKPTPKEPKEANQ